MTMRRIALLWLALFATAWLRAEELPPQPKGYFNDDAHVVVPAVGLKINEQLAQFERNTANQIAVAIYPSLPAGRDLSQYCTATYNSWVVDRRNGQMTGGGNGAALFVFVNDHKMFIATGRDLEGSLPDITCKQIIDNEIAPRFKQGDYTGGVQAGVNAMMAATKGEYKGNGTTVEERMQALAIEHQQEIGIALFIGFLMLMFFVRRYLPAVVPGPYVYTGAGYGRGYGGWGGSMGGGGSGGGFSGFGGFSGGGGGGSAGGGAGGSW